MNFRGVIFDLDGTLLDTLEDIAEAANAALAAMNFPVFPPDAYRYFVGDGMKVLMARILPAELAEDKAVIQEFLLRYLENYNRCWDRKSYPYPGIPELLAELAARKCRLAILSNKPHAFTVKCAEKLLAPWIFDPILGQKEEIPRKPDPAGVRIIQEAWDIKSSEILYLGDTATDMQTAKNGGCFAAGAAWGFRPEKELREAGADVIVRLPLEVVDFL